MQDNEVAPESSESEAPKLETLGSRAGLWFAQDRSIEFKNWDAREEIALSKLMHDSRGAMEGGRVGHKITLTLSQMCTSISGTKFWDQQANGTYKEALSKVERDQFIRRMWETDVLAAYLLLKMDALNDPIASIPLLSPFDPDKKRTIPWKGDLSQLDFKGSDSVEVCQWDYVLRKPFMIRGKRVTQFKMGPLRWQTADSLQFEAKDFEAKMRTILGSIHSIPEVSESEGRAYILADINGLAKPDIEAIADGIEKHHSGLDMEIEVLDPIVDRSYKTSIPWAHPDFFGSSSRS
jgi:hypothetical protein